MRAFAAGTDQICICGDLTKTWDQIDNELRGANVEYGSHDDAEAQRYISIVCPGGSWSPGACAGGDTSGSEILGKIKAWISAHPLETALIAGAAILLRK